MPADLVKTFVVAQDVREEVLSLFGSVANAAKKLQLDLSYGTINQALRGLPVRPQDGEKMEEAWREWKQHFIRGVALGLPVELNNFERVPPEITDALSDMEIEEWRRRLTPRKKR